MNLPIACIIIGAEFALAELPAFSDYSRPTDDTDSFGNSFSDDFSGGGESTGYAQFLSNNREYLPVGEKDNRKPNASYGALSSEYDGPGPLYLPPSTTIIPTTILIPARKPLPAYVPTEPDEPPSAPVLKLLTDTFRPMTRTIISVHPNAEGITASNNPFNVLRQKNSR